MRPPEMAIQHSDVVVDRRTDLRPRHRRELHHGKDSSRKALESLQRAFTPEYEPKKWSLWLAAIRIYRTPPQGPSAIGKPFQERVISIELCITFLNCPRNSGKLRMSKSFAMD